MKKFGLLCLAVVLALGLLGVGYARWAEELYLGGTVETGSVCWEWTGASNIDPGPPPDIVVPDYHSLPGFAWSSDHSAYFWMGPKDVGYTTSEVEVAEHPHHVTLTLHNVYPCYFNEISLYAHNCGTIPIHFERVIIESAYDRYILDWIANEYDPVALDLDGDGCADIEIKWGNHIGAQLHPSENTGEMSFWIHVLQCAPQGKTLTFTMMFEAVQYNESIHPIP